ncbi:FecR family protein [Pedobacter sp. R-06]|uniref:FecR family protein n=1 Tax=Pedobacter sp. R-06 TaxID=3404051 RepID=UPI003CF03CC3
MADKQRIINLLQQFADGNISQGEYAELIAFLKLKDNDSEVFAAMDGVWDNIYTEESYTKEETDYFYQNLVGTAQFKKAGKATIKKRLWPRLAVAASIIVTLSAGIYLFDTNYFANTPSRIANTSKDILPGKSRAVLTLANGETILLNDNESGVVIDASKLTYRDGTEVTSLKQAQIGEKNTVDNDIKVNTPRGGTYQVELPDGSKVWLNAASSLKFPVQFSKKERRVFLNGEAYFEVTKNKQRPFIVETNRQEITVLGTHFNISGYAEDADTKTTLLEGTVHVTDLMGNNSTKDVILKPGQQSVIAGEHLKVFEVDTEEAIAWKNGTFIFSGHTLKEIMKQVERWYDVEVEFENNRKQTQAFRGTVSRFENISQLLEVLESTGSVHFKVKGRRILVMQ